MILPITDVLLTQQQSDSTSSLGVFIIMLVLFTAAFAAAGYATYRYHTRNLRENLKNKEKDISDHKKDE